VSAHESIQSKSARTKPWKDQAGALKEDGPLGWWVFKNCPNGKDRLGNPQNWLPK